MLCGFDNNPIVLDMYILYMLKSPFPTQLISILFPIQISQSRQSVGLRPTADYSPIVPINRHHDTSAILQRIALVDNKISLPIVVVIGVYLENPLDVP